MWPSTKSQKTALILILLQPREGQTNGELITQAIIIE